MQENILENNTKKEKIITKYHLVTLIICAVSAAVLIIARNNEVFANFISNTLSYYMRWILSRITYFIPFSTAEFLLYLSVPLIIVFLVNFNIRLFGRKEARRKLAFAARNLLNIVSTGAIVFILFVWTLGTLYYKTPVEQSIGLNREKLSADDLYNAFIILASELETIDLSPYRTGELNTSMPYGYAEMSRHINDSYHKLSDKYFFYDNVGVRVKPVIMSEVMSRMHITGVYSFFTGESNVNTQFPDYSLPFTAAHEIAHIRGVARENEANFTAFLICYNSDDPYVRYSGIVNMIEYLYSPLIAAASADLFYDAYSRLSETVINEFIGYSEFFEKYRETEISKVANKVNDSYLKSQGQEEGTKSYGMVVDLAVAYLLQK